jgi:uncharacterized surface protein with fasciclin (FAS1) repeats
MKRTTPRVLAIGMAAGLIALSACGSDSDDSDDAAATTEAAEPAESAAAEPAESAAADEAAGEGTIVEVAASAGTFNTLVAAVEAAGLVDTLNSDGPFTVFAPTDEAFAALPDGVLDALLLPENQAALTSILTYHVVAAEVPSSAVETGEVATVEGEPIMLTVGDDGSVMVNDANVIATDVEASNGVIHVIDAVLIPPSVDPAAL